MADRSQIICPHCQTRGKVKTKQVKRKQGISGAKPTGAVLTLGLSTLGTGLSRKQAFFPRDRETGGDLDELTDTDRENTRRLYKLTFDVVQQLAGGLQVIALDHADFEDDWFANSVIQRWRGGDALIPANWHHS